MPPADLAGALLEASPQALACLDDQGRLSWWNAAFAALVPKAASGVSLADALALGDAERAALAEATATAGTSALELQAGPHLLGLRQAPLPGGLRSISLEPLDGLAAARTQARRHAESTQLVRTLGRVAFWERDLVAGTGRWDEEAFRFRGCTAQDPPPSMADAMLQVHEPDRAGLSAALAASIARPDGGLSNYRYRVLGNDGRLRHLHSAWQVLAAADAHAGRIVGVTMDDTETLEQARSFDTVVAQLALATALSGVIVWRHDFATDRIHFNADGFELLRLAPRADGVTKQELSALVHPDDRAAARQSASLAKRSGRPIDHEVRLRRGDGQWRHFLTRRVLQRDADGRPCAFVGVALDVTERIAGARRAAELGRRFDLAASAAGIGYWSAEGVDAPAQWSERLRQIHGLGPDDPVPTLRGWVDRFVPPDDRKGLRDAGKACLDSGANDLQRDLRIVRPDGEVRHLITHSRRETGPDGGTLFFGLTIDVTERRRVEMELRQASERAALAARGAGLGTWEQDLRTGEAFWDPQMWRLRGREPQVRAPDDAERYAMVHPDDKDWVRQQNEQIQNDDAPWNYEFRVLLPDGRERWLASRSVTMLDEAGRPVRRIGVNWDVTDARSADAARREREVAQRESQAKSKFLARMSHELRTPLNGVLGFAQLLLAEDNGDDEGAVVRRRRVEQIRSAGQHLLTLINDVLDLSSLEGGEMRIALQPVPLAPLVADTLPLVEPMLRNSGLTLDCGALDVTPLADATRLRQVLLNLLSNAIKYNRPGGRVQLEAARHDSGVVIRVADSGRGMSDEQLLHLFEPFNRLGVENEGIEGTGIGLAIVKALTERMGGSVHVDSQAGQGSLFELRLPDAALRPLPPSKRPTPSRPVPLSPAGLPPRGTVLYIEDNPVNALIIVELIARRRDLILHVAEDGASGVAKAQSLVPDLILLDMQLPDFDGHEVLRRLRADPATARIPVIALSANAMPADIERALRAGMTDYWTKPLDFSAFMASIDALFGPPPEPAAPAP